MPIDLFRGLILHNLAWRRSSTPALTYSQKVLSYSPTQYLKRNETSGTTASDSSGNGRNGTYSGTTLNAIDAPVTGERAPLDDGVNDYADIFSASLASAFSGSLGSILAWINLTSAQLSDSSIRHIIQFSSTSTTNLILIRKTAANTFQFLHRGNGITVTRDATISTANTWIPLLVTWNVAQNRARFYANGVQSGADMTGIQAWTANLLAAYHSTFAPPTSNNFWGHLAQYALFGTELSAADAADLAVI